LIIYNLPKIVDALEVIVIQDLVWCPNTIHFY